MKLNGAATTLGANTANFTICYYINRPARPENRYPLDQIAAIAEISHALGLKVHVVVDRFAKTLDSLNVSSEEKTWNSGIYLPMASPRKATSLRKPFLLRKG